MITQLYSSDPNLIVNCPAQPYVSTAHNAGAIRFNVINQSIEVSDGYNWVPMATTADVRLGPRAQDILIWAEKKMMEEALITERSSAHPAVADAWEKVKNAQEELLTMMILTEKEDENEKN